MKVVVIGNYEPDGQRSMKAFALLLEQGLKSRGMAAEIIVPSVLLGRLSCPEGLKKWVGYVDKFALFPRRLRRLARAARGTDCVFHIADHSNAMYLRSLLRLPSVITCHDMLAVRGGLGDASACCQASRMGSLLQKWILAGLKSARHVACVSDTTRGDLERLAGREGDAGIQTVPNAGNAPFRPLSPQQITRQLPSSMRHLPQGGYLLMVGSALVRKNRDTALRTLAALKDRWDGFMVIAGEPLNAGQRILATHLGIRDRVLEVEGPGHEQLNALYAGAHALLFPSLAEGFGWPVTEAQACDCPVICSDRTSVPEVAGDAAIVCGAENAGAMAAAVLRLRDEPGLRQSLIERGRANLERFSMEKMLDGYINLYRQALAGRS